MSHCERCGSPVDPSDSFYTSGGDYVCPECFEDSQCEDQSDRAGGEAAGKSNVAVVFAVLAMACALLRLALTLAG